jgi:hypothetical protein
MARQARIRITAETADFKKDIEKIKASIRGLGTMDGKGSRIGKGISDDLKSAEEQIQSRISRIKKSMESLSKAEIIDKDKVDLGLKLLDKYNKRLKEIKETQQGTSKAYNLFDKMESFSPFGSKAGRGLNMIAGAAGAVGLTAGVGSLFQRQRDISQQRNAIAALIGGEVTTQDSALGFTSEERRQRLLEMSRASGRSLSVSEQNLGLGIGETAERAYGISAQEQGGFMGAARRAGIQDQQKAFAQAIGVATAAGLDGSRIGEYLATMSSGISQMSQGINIDNSSLQGFAGALSSLPFFSDDPSRAMRTIQSLNQTFSQGDRFQQAMASRAIQASAPGASASSVELRRRMGLFGELSDEAIDFYSKPENAGSQRIGKALGLKGEQIVTNLFKDSTDPLKGFSVDRQLFEFADRLGLSVGEADPIFRSIKSGKGVSEDDMKRIREANMNPEERIKKVFSGLDSQVTKTGAKIESAMDKMASGVGTAITKFDSAIGVSSTQLAYFGGAVIAATTALTALTAVSAVGSLGKGGIAAGKAMGKGGMAAGKMLGKGGISAGKFMGRNAGRIIPGVGAALALKDIYDIYQKYENGEEVTARDWAILSTSVAAGAAGLVPGVGTVASAGLSALSAGAEFLPESDTASNYSSPSSAMSSPSVSNFTTSDPANTSAVNANTEALRAFTELLRSMGTASSSPLSARYPGNADFLPSNTKTGTEY